uniref:SWIM-type domain-containing protein n=1 Tax=Pygocentrus nattereri TaxID=42514 RepID=A0AAR2KYL8_PYGNA
MKLIDLTYSLYLFKKNALPTPTCRCGLKEVLDGEDWTLYLTDLSVSLEHLPFLIDGFKFDLRIYGLVTLIDSLQVFLYEDGLAHCCTNQYCYPKHSNMHDVCMHLTNYAINNNRENFVRFDNAGSKS